MPRYRNSDVETRLWPHLTNPKTGRTLVLQPNEIVDLPDVVADPHLVEAPRFVRPVKKPTPPLTGDSNPTEEK